ncbi:kinase-like protein [Hypoxylon sp. NC1633]|nr:kinase-like protein [Hypoxylon sp. NC1633]
MLKGLHFKATMGTLADYLPQNISDGSIQELLESVGLPRPTNMVRATVTAQYYHAIFLITIPENTKTTDTELVLRVSGNHLPVIKTTNEVAVMAWVSKNTKIPIPRLLAHDSTTDNPIGHEYTLMSHVSGQALSDIYQSLSPDQIAHILDELIDFLSQLHAHEFAAIGGLELDSQGLVRVGRMVDETFWQTPDLEKFWAPGETLDSLNLNGPYSTYIDLVSAQVRTYIHLIQINDKLAFMRDMIPQLELFVQALPSHADELNNVKLRLAHKDLHFANILYDVSSDTITAILDWEFSGVVPFTNWNPRRAFLWNARDEDGSADEKQRLVGLFESCCRERGVRILEDAAYSSPLQESMQKVADFLRAITEVAPRDQGQDHRVGSWKAIVLENTAKF